MKKIQKTWMLSGYPQRMQILFSIYVVLNDLLKIRNTGGA